MNASLPQPTQQPPQSSSDGDLVDLRYLLDIVSSGRWTLAVYIVLALCIGSAYCWITRPMFRVDALVQIEKKAQSVTGSNNDLYDLISGRDQISTEIEILKSRMVLGRVVEQLRLDIVAEPRYFPFVGRAVARHFEAAHPGTLASPYFSLRNFSWGGERIEVSDLALPEDFLETPLLLRASGNGGFEMLTSSHQVLAAGRVGEPVSFLDGKATIFIRDLIAEPKTEFVLRLRRKLNVIQGLITDLNVVERGKGSSMLSVSLDSARPRDAAEIVNAIASAYQRQNVERRSAEAEQTLDFVNEQLPRVKHDLEAAENAVNSYRLSQKSADLTKETELVLQQSVTLEQQRLQLQQKREESLRKFTSNHPVLQALDGQLQGISREQDALAVRVKGLPETQQELLRLSRDVQVNNSLYTTLLSNAEQLRIAKAGTIGNVRIVDLAMQPHAPIRPRKLFVLALSAFCGVFVGLLATLVRRALNHGVTDPLVIERALHMQTFATIPYTPAQNRIGRLIRRGASLTEGILARQDPGNIAVEAIRGLRTALHVSRSPESNNVIMVCGPSPGLGKSFVSVNLAAAMAMAGRRVVLVDADMRRGHLHQYAGTERGRGLSEAILGQCTPEEIVHPTAQENLSLVPTGTIPTNPSELLLSPGFDKTLQWLSQHFDYVVLDTAPVLVVSDAVIAGRHAGTTLVILKSGQHSLREIEDTLKRLRTGKVTAHGVVLNQVNRGQLGGYGYDSGYYNYDYRPTGKQ